VVRELERRVNEFSEIEHIDRLKNYFLPKITRFASMIDTFEAHNVKVNEIIRKFDETLSMKANKS